MKFYRWVATMAALGIPAFAAPDPAWRLTSSDHFEIYAQSSDQRARAILIWFEQLRAFFEQQNGVKSSPSQRVRVIVFASAEEYQPYRLAPTADAYYVGNGRQNFIVMAGSDARIFGLAAHEYAHLALRESGLQLPPWLKEGLAEFFSTLRIDEHGAELGALLPGRVRSLERADWTALPQLLSITDEMQRRQDRSRADLFYAESWALTEVLALSPDYASGFQKFVARVASGTPGAEALMATYGKPINAIAEDVHAFVYRNKALLLRLPEVSRAEVAVKVSEVSAFAARLLLAQLLLASNQFDPAEMRFSELAREAPESSDVSVALGVIALHKHDSAAARLAWKRAIDQGVTDAKLCYRYAILADQAGLPADEIRPALDRAVKLRPDFDDARFQLALLEKNSGRYEVALQQFQAMRQVADARAYAYWLALADTYNELNRRDEAQSAALRANEHAATAEERSLAAKEIYIAQTDPGVQFARDASGQLQLVTTRMPHQQSDWNPFIEPADDIRRVQGTLRQIECGDVTTVRLEAAGKLITLSIPDLQHVQMRHAPSEFVCGAQDPAARVIVDYTATGLVRGMDFQ